MLLLDWQENFQGAGNALCERWQSAEASSAIW